MASHDHTLPLSLLSHRCLYLQEYFAPGSLFSVKDMHSVRGERRVINFYHSARLDGLMRREERAGMKLMEFFTGRDDRLVYRSATFGQHGQSGAAAGHGAGSAGEMSTMNGDSEQNALNDDADG